MMSADALAARIEFPTHRDRDFFLRVYGTPRDVYADRLRAIGFEGRQAVLDAGCGFGQWALALAELNRRVDAFDMSALRVGAVRQIAIAEHKTNVRVCRSTIDSLPYLDGSFDALFCYGAVFFTDYRVSFREFARVLAPGGLLYFTANAIGWYIYNLVAAHKPSKDFSPRRMATTALRNTAMFAAGSYESGREIAFSPAAARRVLQKTGFEVLGVAGDGELSVRPGARGRQFFQPRKYGLRSVYEVLCRKR